MLWNESTSPDQKEINLHKQLFGVAQDKRFISAIEAEKSPPRRSIAIEQTWDTPEGNYIIHYRTNTDKEARNSKDQHPIRKKIKFLKEILQTTVDKNKTARPFGRPYVAGDTYGDDSPTSDGRIHRAYWVRDLKNTTIADILDCDQNQD